MPPRRADTTHGMSSPVAESIDAARINRLLGRWHAALEVVNRHAAAIEQIASGVPTAATLQAARDRQQLYRAARAKAQAIEGEIRRAYEHITGEEA